jgi:Cu(I)/Ag(I) efflux system protein CusF
MKLVIAAVALAIASPAIAQHGGHDHPAAAAPAAGAIKGTGVVKAVNAKAGTVKIHHAPIAALKWPAMTMDFKASPQVLAAAKTGKSVTFTLDTAGKEVLSLQ